MKPRKNRSKYASKKYDNLYMYPDRPTWIYRKYSSEKRQEFVYSTGFKKESEAYSAGVDAFDKWLGVNLPAGRDILIRDIARAVLAAKESKKGGKLGDTYRSVRNQIMKHIIPAFGHLSPAQITPLRWDLYDSEERKRIYHKAGKGGAQVPYSRTTTSHTRQVLIEILRRAHEEGLIRLIPKLKKHDQAPAPPRYIPKADVLRIIRFARRRGRATKLLAFIMWKQGPRPAEALQYRWDMIRWEEGPNGTIHIPAPITKTGRARQIPLNPKVARILRWLQPRSESPYIFPSQGDPERPQGEYKTGWLSACRRAGLDYQTYNLRDTFITNCLKRGISSTFIARVVDNSPLMIDSKYAIADQEQMGKVTG